MELDIIILYCWLFYKQGFFLSELEGKFDINKKKETWVLKGPQKTFYNQQREQNLFASIINKVK